MLPAVSRYYSQRSAGRGSTSSTARIQALGLALLDFSGADDLAAWLNEHAG